MLLLLVPQLLAAAPVQRLAQLGQAHPHPPHPEATREHRNAVHKVRMLQRLRAAEWELRRDAVEDLLQAYRARHQACVNSSGLPGQYFVLHTLNNVSGIGNQLPSVISGAPASLCSIALKPGLPDVHAASDLAAALPSQQHMMHRRFPAGAHDGALLLCGLPLLQHLL